MSAQTSLSAFDSAAAPKPEPDPAADYDGLQAVAAAVTSGYSTTQAREDRSHDRVVSDDTCPRCGAPYDGEGVCPEHAAEGDLVDQPLHTISSSRGGR